MGARLAAKVAAFSSYSGENTSGKSRKTVVFVLGYAPTKWKHGYCLYAPSGDLISRPLGEPDTPTLLMPHASSRETVSSAHFLSQSCPYARMRLILAKSTSSEYATRRARFGFPCISLHAGANLPSLSGSQV